MTASTLYRLLIWLFICFSIGDCAVFNCSDETFSVQTFDMPSGSFFYPGQNCTLTFLYPSNTYMSMFIEVANLSNDDKITIFNDYGNIIESNNETRWAHSANFPPNATYLRIKTGNNSRISFSFNMKINNFTLNDSKNATNLRLGPDKDPYMFTFNYLYSTYVFTSATHVVLSTINYPIANDYSRWTGIFVYEGNGTDAQLLGTALNTFGSKSITSKGNSLTIFATDSSPYSSYLVINDYTHTSQYGSCETAWATNSDLVRNSIRMNTLLGPSALTVGNAASEYATYITDITFSDPTATLTVFAGPPTTRSDYKLTEYRHTDKSLTSRLPQQFPGYLRTFVLDKGYAILNVTDAIDETEWHVAKPGRTGIIFSSDYPYTTTDQKVQTMRLNTATSQTFEFNVTLLNTIPPPSNGYVSMQSVDGTNFNNVNKTFSEISGKTTTLRGQSMSLKAQTDRFISSRGVAFSFEMSSTSGGQPAGCSRWTTVLVTTLLCGMM